MIATDSQAAQQQQDYARPVLPVCPHCGADPAGIASAPLQIRPGVVAIALFCANLKCRKMHAVQIMAVEQSPIVPPGNVNLHRNGRG